MSYLNDGGDSTETETTFEQDNGESTNTDLESPIHDVDTTTEHSPSILPVDLLQMGEEAEKERSEQEQLEETDKEQQSFVFDIFDSLF